MSTPLSRVDSDGFVILPGFLSDGELGHLEQILPALDPQVAAFGTCSTSLKSRPLRKVGTSDPSCIRY